MGLLLAILLTGLGLLLTLIATVWLLILGAPVLLALAGWWAPTPPRTRGVLAVLGLLIGGALSGLLLYQIYGEDGANGRALTWTVAVGVPLVFLAALRRRNRLAREARARAVAARRAQYETERAQRKTPPPAAPKGGQEAGSGVESSMAYRAGVAVRRIQDRRKSRPLG